MAVGFSCKERSSPREMQADGHSPALPAARRVPLPDTSALPSYSERTPPSSAGTPATRPPNSDAPTPAPRDHANETLTGTKFTHASQPRGERCFLCRYVQAPLTVSNPESDGVDIFDRPEQGIVQRMRCYWEANVLYVDFQVRYLGATPQACLTRRGSSPRRSLTIVRASSGCNTKLIGSHRATTRVTTAPRLRKWTLKVRVPARNHNASLTLI